MKFAFIFSLSAMLLRLALFFTYTAIDDLNRHVLLLHLLFILLATVLNILFGKVGKNSSSSPILQNIQKGMTAAVPYAVLTAIFAAVYFSFVDPEGFYGRRAAWIAAAPDEKAVESLKTTFTIFNYSTITLIGLMLAGVICSVMVGSLMHIIKNKLRV